MSVTYLPSGVSRPRAVRAACRRPRAPLLAIVFGHGGLHGAGEVQTFRDLRADGVVLIGRDRDRRQDADDRDDDHQLDEGETLLHRLHDGSSLYKLKNSVGSVLRLA